MGKVEKLSIVTVQILKNRTHLLQPLDLTTKLIFKKLEKQSFSGYFTDSTTALARDPKRDNNRYRPQTINHETTARKMRE